MIEVHKFGSIGGRLGLSVRQDYQMDDGSLGRGGEMKNLFFATDEGREIYIQLLQEREARERAEHDLQFVTRKNTELIQDLQNLDTVPGAFLHLCRTVWRWVLAVCEPCL